MTGASHIYFFFGTLMDRDVLELVLDRPVAPDELTPAHLDGYARVYAKGELFPVLVDDGDGAVDGIVLSLTSADVARITHYEDDDYALTSMDVTLPGGETRTAEVHIAAKGDLPTDRPWDLARWQRDHKADFMEMAASWMSGDPEWPGTPD